MNMKDHMLAAMREQFERWEDLLAILSEEAITAPRFDLDWSIKDVMAHLWAWQQVSIARMEGGVYDREPEYPGWIVNSIKNWEEDADRVNARTFETYHKNSWQDVYQRWRNGYLQLLEAGYRIPERDLLDSSRYPWLKGYSLAFILVASYEHHQEHFEKSSASLEKL